MKKVFLLATAALLFGATSFADNGKKGKKKKCAKGKSCCSQTTKSCCKAKSSTVKM